MGDTVIALHIVPKSSKNEIVGWVDDGNGKQALKVKIAAPPEDGKANRELLKFFSKQLDISISTMEIVSGETARRKRLRLPDQAALQRLRALS